jgi:hypothetical protein
MYIYRASFGRKVGYTIASYRPGWTAEIGVSEEG